VKLPLERMTYSGSTSSWIADADGNDIARVSGGPKTAVVAFKDKDAEQIVFAVNNQDAWLTQIREYERIMKESRERHEEVLGTCKELRQQITQLQGAAYGDEAYFLVMKEEMDALGMKYAAALEKIEKQREALEAIGHGPE